MMKILICIYFVCVSTVGFTVVQTGKGLRQTEGLTIVSLECTSVKSSNSKTLVMDNETSVANSQATIESLMIQSAVKHELSQCSEATIKFFDEADPLFGK